jgi:hypothetical protein
VTADATKHSAWAEYAAVLLDEETAAFFAARLTDDSKEVIDGESNPPSKKKKRELGADNGAAEGDAAPEVICEHCGGAVPEISPIPRAWKLELR